MALQGRARESHIFGGSKTGASGAVADAEYQLRRTGAAYRREEADKPPTEKQAYTWFKDLYSFASANKDNLSDPDVQDIIDRKMQKIEQTGFFTRSPRRQGPGKTQMVDAGGGFEGAVHQGEPESEQDRILRDINAMQHRFMVENVSQYGPQTQDVYDPSEGYVTKRFDPIMGDKVLGSKVSQLAEGSGLFTVGPKGKGEALMERPKTATPGSEDKDKVLAYNIKDPSKTKWVKKGDDAPEGYTLNKPGAETGKLTEKQRLDILNDVEQQILKYQEEMKTDKTKEITKEMIDAWNRQLKMAELDERVTEEEITEQHWYGNRKKKKARVVEGTGKSLDEIFGRK